MRSFIEYIAKSIVDEPNSVIVDEIADKNKVLLKLRVGKSDIGKVIGKQGKTAKSLRILLTAFAAKNNKKGQLEIEGNST